jgi:Flp pilus assembly protein TadG
MGERRVGKGLKTVGMRAFRRAEAGNVAMLFALGLIPMIGMVGFAIDYSRGSNARTAIASAVDTAVLAANRDPDLPLAKKTAIARNILRAHLENKPWIRFDAGDIIVTENDDELDIAFEADVSTTFMSVLGMKTMPISVGARSARGKGEDVEIALVLDTTGSMIDDMDSLRSAAKSFVQEALDAAGSNDNVKIALVPYVAAVNPGPMALSGLMDYSADAAHHAQSFEHGGYVASAPGCGWPANPNPNPAPVDPNPQPPPPPFDPGAGGQEGAFLGGWLDRFAGAAGGLFGASPAAAAGPVTPRTAAPFATTTFTGTAPPYAAPFSVQVPAGFVFGGCELWNPPKISQFDLFDRTPGATWAGCVEARRQPYDVTDETPSTINPDTLFVPYFWPDEPDGSGGTNDYIKDLPSNEMLVPYGYWPITMGRQDAMQGILKYNGTDNGGDVEIDEAGPVTKGPNKACPEPIVALTGNKGQLISSINALEHKFGGGTIVSEGVMWGWRVLSPGQPFAQGKPYGKARKVLVLMSDGKNEMNEADIDGNVIYGDYTAYGYLGQYETRLAMGVEGVNQGARVQTFAEASAYLDERTALACANAKAAGVKIITILFRDQSPAARNAMRACASAPEYALVAADGDALERIFEELGSMIHNLRLTR